MGCPLPLLAPFATAQEQPCAGHSRAAGGVSVSPCKGVAPVQPQALAGDTGLQISTCNPFRLVGLISCVPSLRGVMNKA